MSPTTHLTICQKTVLSELPYIKDLFIYYYPSYLSPDEKLLLATYWDQFLVVLHLEEMQTAIGSLSYTRKFLKDPQKGDINICFEKTRNNAICEPEESAPTSSALILELVRHPQKYLKIEQDPFFSAEMILFWVQYLINVPNGPKNYPLVEKNNVKRIDKYPTHPIMLQEIPSKFFISAFAWAFFSQFILIEKESAVLVEQVQNLYQKYQNFPFLANIRGGAVDHLHSHTKSHPIRLFIDPNSQPIKDTRQPF